jgi:hypothetical protein
METFHPNPFTVVTVSTYRDRGRDVVITVTQTFDKKGNPLPASTTRSESPTRFTNALRSGAPIALQAASLATMVMMLP